MFNNIRNFFLTKKIRKELNSFLKKNSLENLDSVFFTAGWGTYKQNNNSNRTYWLDNSTIQVITTDE